MQRIRHVWACHERQLALIAEVHTPAWAEHCTFVDTIGFAFISRSCGKVRP